MKWKNPNDDFSNSFKEYQKYIEDINKQKESPKTLRLFEIHNSDETFDVQAEEIRFDECTDCLSLWVDGKIIAQFWNVTAWIEII